MLKRIIISVLMVGVVVLAFASKGGGDKKKASSALDKAFTPIRTTNGFTLKSGLSYSGSLLFSSHKTNNFVMFNTVATYEKGNTIYILPYKYKMNTRDCFKSNLQLLDLKVRLHK